MNIDNSLIAPCGMNCRVCIGYLRDRNKCYGCRMPAPGKPKSRRLCRIKNCEHLKKTVSNFCYECEIYPCARLKQLDKRYRTKYHMSMIDNLNSIKKIGLDQFVQNEYNRWLCKNCGGTICVHRGFCLNCGN